LAANSGPSKRFLLFAQFWGSWRGEYGQQIAFSKNKAYFKMGCETERREKI
jgi:hypothetical protein